jgi:hypothetical protein
VYIAGEIPVDLEETPTESTSKDLEKASLGVTKGRPQRDSPLADPGDARD